MTEDQLAFDVEGMLHEAAVEVAPEWNGAPLHFTTDYYSPSDLDAAFEHWQFLHQLDDFRQQSRMWHRAAAVPGGVRVGEHGFDMFTADLRCLPWKHPEGDGECACVGDLTYMAVCEPCGWQVIGGEENAAVEAWHDHAFPGWRVLPIVPAHLPDISTTGLSKSAKKWIETHYPTAMQVVGAPVITERSSVGTARPRPVALGWVRHLPHRRGPAPEDHVTHAASYVGSRTQGRPLAYSPGHRDRRLTGALRTPERHDNSAARSGGTVIHVELPATIVSLIPMDIDINPNSDGLPGIGQLRSIVGASMTIGLILAVLALIISAVVWALGANSSNPHLAGRGKLGVLVGLGAAIITGASVALVNFFWNVGQAV